MDLLISGSCPSRQRLPGHSGRQGPLSREDRNGNPGIRRDLVSLFLFSFPLRRIRNILSWPIIDPRIPVNEGDSFLPAPRLFTEIDSRLNGQATHTLD
ncbi:MAG: hypothetical protein M1537_00790 [Nitrospirae bacterium]|nr:hypothetical protein [Nitrospirota bacterium]MCL5284502.1 hypothetical protein [Nitrospirota bacterium]